MQMSMPFEGKTTQVRILACAHETGRRYLGTKQWLSVFPVKLE